MDERIDKIRNSDTWKLGWNSKASRSAFKDLMKILDSYNIPKEEVDDILYTALLAAMNEGRQR